MSRRTVKRLLAVAAVLGLAGAVLGLIAQAWIGAVLGLAVAVWAGVVWTITGPRPRRRFR